jgi:hypothetical protein
MQGNSATGDCCSKCWRDKQKKEGLIDVSPAPPQFKVSAEPMEIVADTSATMDVDAEPRQEEEVQVEPMAEDTPKKRKKKKPSYKNMMATMMRSGSPTRDIEKEKEDLRKVTGGGAFSKIEKI